MTMGTRNALTVQPQASKIHDFLAVVDGMMCQKGLATGWSRRDGMLMDWVAVAVRWILIVIGGGSTTCGRSWTFVDWNCGRYRNVIIVNQYIRSVIELRFGWSGSLDRWFGCEGKATRS